MKRRGRSGLTLAELVLALGLTVAVLISVAVVMSRGLSWLRQTRHRTVAQSAARDVLERVRLAGPAALPPDGVFDGKIPTPRVGSFPPDPYFSIVESERLYTIRVAVSTVRPGLRSVQVDVSWGGKATVSLETYLQ